jgi:DNA repair protein RecN (Recombination protein N)
VRDGRTATCVTELDREGRTNEIARLLAGEKITPSALTHAAEMLRSAASGQN